MRAIILAAGSSRRLRPLTRQKPKCMLPLDGETIIDRQLRNLKNAGISEAVFVVGFQKEKLMRHLASRHGDIALVFIENPRFAETHAGYSLMLSREHLSGGALYLNADVVCHENILTEIINHQHESVTAIQQTPWQAEQVNIVTDKTGRIVEIGKHITAEASRGEFVGVTKIGPIFAEHLIRILEELKHAGDHKRFAADAINLAIQKYGGIKYAHDVTHYLAREIDVVEEYDEIARMIKEA